MIHKTIIYSFVTLTLIVNTIIIYLLNQTSEILLNTEIMIKLISTISILVISLTIIFQSNLSQRALYKKNILKLNFIIIFIILVASINQRIIEFNNNSLISLRIVQTSLYLTLLIITILLLKDLRKLIKKLFPE
jgi:hypothetical protein